MQIKDFKPNNPFFLAPMEAVNCTSFRIICRRRGAGIVWTDMIDSDEFVLNPDIKKFINPNKEDHPLAVQIAGSNIENIKETIKILEPYADLFDFNIGCPLGKINGKKAGCYLMKHPNNLYKIIPEMRKATTKPLLVKLRSGWDENSINAIEVAQELEKLGVDAITLHARTKEQGYQKKSDWNLVKKLKEKLNIPVILSGDVFNVYDAKQAFEKTNCDFIMIGRGAKANPSIFTQLQNYEMASKKEKIYCKNEVNPVKDFLEWLELYHKIEGRNNFSEIKDHAIWTSIECKNNKEVKQLIINSKTEEELIEIVKSLKF
ncbi:MAG: tRNA dihydrouridine synthase [Candidatus Woesearchaeota archaeon]